ncbi:MAG: HAMP domain-containing protein [Ignavibacteriae bacterium]|nr:MAG: HAMP domain-containing protein [Ignavibacteriota bacterium]
MKIQTKITATYVVFELLIVASLGTFTSMRMESYFKERLLDELSRQADLVYYILEKDTTNSFPQIDQQVKLIGGLEHLRITLIRGDGNVLADSDIPLPELTGVKNHLDRPEIQGALQHEVGYDIRRSATVDHDYLYMAKRIRPLTNRTGFASLQFIRLSVPLEDVQNQINRIRSMVIVVGLGVLLVIVAVSVIISRRITKSMVQIARGVEQIRSGDLDVPLVISSNDEIGLVAKAVNELVQKLKSDIVQLKKLEQVRSQFLGNVSHELRTPIFAVQGYLETLLGGAVDDPSVNRSFLEKAQSNLGRLNVLLEDLINISQIESGEMKMSLRYFRLNEFLESVTKDHEPLAAARGVTLTLALQTSNEDEAFGDKDRLRQVFNNLISNALNYNTPGGSVNVVSQKTDRGVHVRIQDTGVGIPAEHISRIFERFYRVDNNRSRSLGGTGLGLAIVKHIVEAHGSRIQVESKTGEGSTFYFDLKSS